MLPRRSRVRTPAEHALVARRGRRARRGPITVHLHLTGADGAPRAGFVVGRAVGKAVVRNRVRRRLREQVRTRLPELPDGALLIVRAAPESADADSAALGRALDAALEALLRTAPTRGTGTGAPS